MVLGIKSGYHKDGPVSKESGRREPVAATVWITMKRYVQNSRIQISETAI